MNRTGITGIMLACMLVSVVSRGVAQSADKDAAAVMEIYKRGLLKKDFTLLKPYLADTYTVGEFKRPQADEVVSQLMVKGPSVMNIKIVEMKQYKDRTEVMVEYEVKGHLFGTATSVSVCKLTPQNKFSFIQYFDEMLSKAIRKPVE